MTSSSCFFKYFLFWGSEVHQKYVVWVLIGCIIKFRIQWALSIGIWVKTRGDMSKIRIKKEVFLWQICQFNNYGWLILLKFYWFLNSNSQELILAQAHFRPQISSNARSLTYEVLRWAVLTDHYCISGLWYSPMSGLSLRTVRFEDRCSHLVIAEQLLMPSFISVLSHWTDDASDGLYCMIMTHLFILRYGYHCSYTDFCDMY